MRVLGLTASSMVLALFGISLFAAELPLPAPARLPPRPELTPDAYRQQVDQLQAAYAKPIADWPKANFDPQVRAADLGPLPAIEHPPTNPFSKDKVELGKALFFDPRLSGSGQVACASCHDPDLGWADGRKVSFGHARKALRRNAPGLLNIGLGKSFFWDGRASTLEEQAIAVVLNPDEMRGGVEADVVTRLKQVDGYPQAFQSAFGDDTITLARIGQAIATFERTLKGGRSRFDQFLAGKPNVLTDSEVRGLHLFRTDARCINCHNGPRLTDDEFHDLGLSYYGRSLQDLGRYSHTKKPEDVGRFKTPSLRNLSRTGPYMHNGLFELPGVLRMYNAGMATLRPKGEQLKDPLFPKKSPLLKPLGLNKQDLADLEAFLRTLGEPRQFVSPSKLLLLDQAEETKAP